MKSRIFCATVTMRQMKRTFCYENKAMLTLSITYPQIILRHNPPVQNKINRQIQAQVNDFYHYASNSLYPQSIDAYKHTQENGFPFHHYETSLQYKITYNQHCHLSLYRDQYEFTGGAHGNTIRASDNWNLIHGCSIPLSCFFPHEHNYRALMLEQILEQANQQMQQNPGIFFEDYRTLIVQHFNENSYYLTPSGVAIYYQQYEIAPYVTGIVVFTIPCKTLPWHPSCRKSSSFSCGRP